MQGVSTDISGDVRKNADRAKCGGVEANIQHPTLNTQPVFSAQLSVLSEDVRPHKIARPTIRHSALVECSMLIRLRDNLPVKAFFAGSFWVLFSEQMAEKSARTVLCHATG